MKDMEIRRSFHEKELLHHHADEHTLVIDELGLKHGTSRADIAVLNDQLSGYEIKSDSDSLSRLPSQIEAYNSVFDRITMLATERHLPRVWDLVPEWWGIVLCSRGEGGAVHFHTKRKPVLNRSADPLSIAQLLWRSEAVGLLEDKGEDPRTLRKPRTFLYQRLCEIMNPGELKSAVTSCLRKRKNWRCPEPPFRCGDSSLPDAK